MSNKSIVWPYRSTIDHPRWVVWVEICFGMNYRELWKIGWRVWNILCAMRNHWYLLRRNGHWGIQSPFIFNPKSIIFHSTQLCTFWKDSGALNITTKFQGENKGNVGQVASTVLSPKRQRNRLMYVLLVQAWPLRGRKRKSKNPRDTMDGLR